MPVTRSVLRVLTLIACGACVSADESTSPPEILPSLEAGVATDVFTRGFGKVDLSSAPGATDAAFEVIAKIKRDGTASGHFFQRRTRNGLVVAFTGTVTCMTMDASLGRARIGGVITRNNSTDPAFLTDNHEVGDDVWFRVQDGDVGGGAVDGSTTFGFKPTLVNTSAEYCALPFTGTSWSLASIFPLRSGAVQVYP